MKKFLLILLMAGIGQLVSGQNCQAYFTFDSTGTGYNFYDMSYNTDSSQINVIIWDWTFTDNSGSSQTSSLQNPTDIVLNPQSPIIQVCLTITTDSLCMSSYCDSLVFCNLSVFGNTNPADTACNGTIDLTVSGGTAPFSYIWSNGSTTPNQTNLCPGTYSVTITDSNGCVVYDTYTIYSDSTGSNCQAFFVYYNDNGTVYFYDSSYAAPSATVIDYTWTFPGGVPSTSTSENPIINYNTPGSYVICLTISTSNGCINTFCDSIFIQGGNPCTLQASLDVTPVSVAGGNDGSIEVTVTGGTPPYSFIWNNGATTQDIFNLYAGTYGVTITDAGNCSGSAFYATIYEPYDTTGGSIVDTLFSGIVDTCLSFTPDSFYISQINVTSNDTVVVTWAFVGNGSIQTIDITYQFTTPGNQAVMLTIDCNGSKILSSYMSYIYIDANLTNVSQASEELIFNLYPNPANNEFTIQAEPPYTIAIRDLTGRILSTKQINSMNFTFDTQSIPAGIYIINISQKDSSGSKKLIVVH